MNIPLYRMFYIIFPQNNTWLKGSIMKDLYTYIMTLSQLNESIEEQYDKYFASILKDIHLDERFKNAKSTQANTKFIGGICEDLKLDQRQSRYLHRVLERRLLSSGMKASVRGNKMNEYVKKVLMKLVAVAGKGRLYFERKHPLVPEIHEIPDWTLEVDGHIYIGFNQLDLWNGGAQVNRASKYIMDDDLHRRLNKRNVYIICLVARKIQFKAYNKVAKIIEHGIKRQRLFWLKGLKEYLKST
jgi:hypothetical protein